MCLLKSLDSLSKDSLDPTNRSIKTKGGKSMVNLQTNILDKSINWIQIPISVGIFAAKNKK